MDEREAMSRGWDSAMREVLSEIRLIPSWGHGDKGGFDLCEDEDGRASEARARTVVMQTLRSLSNPYLD